jgi:hypothetical protein
MPARSLSTLVLLLISGTLGVAAPEHSFGVGDVAVVNRTPLMTGAPALKAVTSDEGVALRGRFYWKTVHGEDVESFVLDVVFLDGQGRMLGRSAFDSGAIRLGAPFDVPIGAWLPAPGGVDRAALRQIVLTVRTLRTGLFC